MATALQIRCRNGIFERSRNKDSKCMDGRKLVGTGWRLDVRAGSRKKSSHRSRKQRRTTAGATAAEDRQTDCIYMPLLPSITVQQCSQRNSSRCRALRHAVARARRCCYTCFLPCLPRMWHGGPVGESCREKTKQTQEA